jgi:hypothetical protein
MMITGTMSGMPAKDAYKSLIPLRRQRLCALILNQVENGVAVRMAVLYLLAGGE